MPSPKAGSNSLFSSSFFIFIIRFFPSLANTLVLIWYSRHLPQATYGQYQSFWIQLNVIYPLICFGIHVFVITYSREMLAGIIRRLSARHYALYGIWLILLGGLFAFLQGRSTGVPWFISFFLILFFSISLILEALLLVSRQYKSLSVISVVYSLAYCAIHWYVLTHGFSFYNVFILLLLLSAARFVGYSLLTLRSFKAVSGHEHEAQDDIKPIRSLWLHMAVYDISQVLFSWVDKFAISMVLTASLSAVYFNGSQNIPFLPLMLSAAGSAALITLAGGNKHEERGDMIRLVNETGRMLSSIVFPVFFFLLLFRSEVITYLFSDAYAAAIPVFAAAILVLPVKAYSFTTILQRMHKGALINIGAVADLVLACALMYPLYQWLGLPGVALSFVITTYLQAMFYLVYSARLLRVSVAQLVPLGNWLIKLIVFACIFIGIHYVGSVYFRKNISLILGGAVMVIAIGVSLFIEVSKQKKYVRIG